MRIFGAPARSAREAWGIAGVTFGTEHGQADAARRIEALRPALIRFFMRRLGDPAEAEDLTQEALTRLLSVQRGDGPDDPQAFVFRIALNLLNDRGRRARTQSQMQLAVVDPTRVSEITHEFVEDRTPERVLQGKRDVARVVRILGELNERTRDVYVLFRLEGMKHADIARLYGISRSTVEKDVMRATMHLTLRIAEDDR